MDIRPLSARSVVLSLLLGAHPPELAARDLVAVAEHFGISETTLRVALTRMVAAGDLERSDATYRLSDRLLARQRRQDTALEPATRDWDGLWETVVVTSSGRTASDRAELRTRLSDLRLSELREGVWMRPANLERPLPAWPVDRISVFSTNPAEDPRGLTGRLWDVDGWNTSGRAMLAALETATAPADRIAIAAAMVRQLRTDPVLPEPLLPSGWVGPELRAAYTAYQGELIDLGLQVRASQ